VAAARRQVAALINADEDEIYFTSSGTEADNWALFCVSSIAAKGNGKGHIITSAVEHHAVLHTCEHLEDSGYAVTYLPVDEYGRVSADAVRDAMTDDTLLISVMLANNEIGTIQPIKEIGRLARERGVFFHTDAVAAAGHISIDVNEMNIDLLSLSGHKLYAFKGTGALFARKGIKLPKLLHGGAHERGRRAGTENVPGIVALGMAAELALAELPQEQKRLTELRDYLAEGLLKIPDSRLNGHPSERLPGNVNVSFDYIEGESILLMLSMKGIYASSGSACTTSSLDPSHVLLATGIPAERAHGSLRLTLGLYNTKQEADILLEELPKIVEKLRQMSPLVQ
jgi:cysteine desulfurase